MKILGLGTAEPEYSLEQAQSARFAEPLCCTSKDQKRLLRALYRRTRIRRRGSVLLSETGGGTNYEFFPIPESATDRGPGMRSRMEKYEKFAARLGLRAASTALSNSGLEPSAITHLITVSCTGFFAPGIELDLVGELHLRRDVERTHVGFMGCHAVLNALRVARGLVSSDPAARVLVVSVELCSLHYQYGWDPDQVVSNAIFADGAGALVCASEGEGPWTVRQNGSYLVRDSADAMTWKLGNHGFEMTLSPRVPSLIESNLPGFLEQWLSKAGLSIDDIATWAVHPGGTRILDAVEKALGRPRGELTKVSRHVLAEHGNMSSATMVFLLSELAGASLDSPCVALGFGPGLAVEAALLDGEE